MKKLLLPYAFDVERNLVYIDDARKGQKYLCPSCGAELSLKISKIPEGHKYHRRNHFAHKGNTGNHCSESFLHKLFKENCAGYIRDIISSRENIFFEWECVICNEHHKRKLLNDIVSVATEYDLGVCKPDVALLDNEGNVVAVVEVVVSHKPEPATLQYYSDHNILCLQIVVDDFPDCDNILEKLSHPSCVNLCPNPICEKCGGVMQSPKLVTVKSSCRNCDQQMFVAMIVAPYTLYSPKDFNEKELNIARTLGANIQVCHSKTANASYNANVCESCGCFIGDFYIADYFDEPHEDEVDLDFRCFHCLDEAHIE